MILDRKSLFVLSGFVDRFNIYKFILFIIIVNIIATFITTALAEDEEARLYTTREERREAGIKHQLAPWLFASGLAEFEWNWENFQLQDSGNSDKFENTAANLQIGIFATPLDWLNAEIITEYDTDIDEWTLDEAELSVEYDAWELVAGKQFLPFGNFISHFANGPIIEFGETSDPALSLNYNYHDDLDVSVSAYRSDARKINSNDRLDWSAAIEAWPTDYLSFGISYLSDLADSDARLLEVNNNRYSDKVPALSGYLLGVAEQFEISLEVLGDLDSFHELAPDRDRPQAFNLEFTHFLTPKLDWALRIEGSRELEDAPELQLGIAVNYRLFKNVAFTFEALRGYFKDTLATDDNGNSFESVDTLGAQLSIGF